MTEITYTLPGWGFDAQVFDNWLGKPNHTPLNYIQFPYHRFDDWIKTLAKQIKPNSHLIGWSFGGLLAIALAGQFPKRIKHLTLLACSPKAVNAHLQSPSMGMGPSETQAFFELAHADFGRAQQTLYRLCAHPIRNRTYQAREYLPREWMYREQQFHFQYLNG